MVDQAEKKVSQFYNTVGWKTENEVTEDAKRWEDLREHAQEYVRKCRLRVLHHIPAKGVNILDMASGPIQYREYLEYSRNFEKRYCVDLSSAALEEAKNKIGDHGVFLHGSFFDLPMEENFFDCSISLHTIYHMDKDKQEQAVRKLISVTKLGQPVVIIYSNPNSIVSFLRVPFRVARNLKRNLQKIFGKSIDNDNMSLYFHPHPLEWWSIFRDVANVEILPWRSFGADDQKRFIPNNSLGRKMFDILFRLENKFPNFFVKYFQYPMVILTKRSS